ncbi:SAM-dependent methyltransferase [Rhodoblastus sphagnicola]|nr:class I SAM-dependent methyltransferase [Rhodoblastus sphagnicola]MBB4196308.1 SAM-dependent methyltransferase [Rhodoblastus sphagnicola]
MSGEALPIISDVDFGLMYRAHQARAGARAKPPAFWDDRARDFDARQRARDSYFDAFIARMDFSGCDSLIDVGCGNGALAVALAPRLKTILGVDYSPAMLDLARRRAAEAGATNVTLAPRAWEDDWSDLPRCDIAVASRSTGVMDLEPALRKLDRQAKKRVYLTASVSGRIVNPALLDALGRPPAPKIDKPDYIYVVNLLYRMGRLAKVDFIARDRAEDSRADWAGFQRNVALFLGKLSEAEAERLRAWKQHNPEAPLFERDQAHWAFISWAT